MLFLQLDDLLLEVNDALLQLHLDELFVTTCVLPHLVKHALVLLLELIHLTAMLLSQARLHLIVVLLGLLFESLEFFLCLLKLYAKGFARLITALHRIVELRLEVHDFGAQLLNCAV